MKLTYHEVKQYYYCQERMSRPKGGEGASDFRRMAHSMF